MSVGHLCFYAIVIEIFIIQNGHYSWALISLMLKISAIGRRSSQTQQTCFGSFPGYQLEKRKLGGQWEKVNSTPVIGETTTVSDLEEGQEYEYRVAAITEVGVGGFSFATPPVKAERKICKLINDGLFLLNYFLHSA